MTKMDDQDDREVNGFDNVIDYDDGEDIDKAAQDLTYTTFDYNSDDDDDDIDDVVRRYNTDEKEITVKDDLERSGHHSLPDYPPVDIFHRKMIGRRQISLVCHKFLSKCNSLTIVLAVGLLGCIIALSSQSRPIEDFLEGFLADSSAEAIWAALPPANEPLKSLAFGSCSDQKMPMSYWDTLASTSPDVTILMGDNVYGDCEDPSCQTLKEAYDTLASHPSFIGARSMLPMVAIPDDHDYGKNDANENNPAKDVAKDLFLDFFAVPSNDERRSRSNDGLYTSYEWGPKGQRVQLILLDSRYSRSEFKPTDKDGAPGKERYVPDDDPKKLMLSEAQWGWLEGLLSRPANVRLIVSSIQVMADGHGFECWRMLPNERDRLYELLQPTLENSRTVILSGDRHVGGFYEHKTEELYEVTASSWTHTMPLGAFGNCNSTKECDEKDPRRMDDFVRVNNFGMVEFNWEKNELILSLRRVESTIAAHYEEDGAKAGDELQVMAFSIPHEN